MGMSASTLRLTMLTARLSQLQFQGQQINQQRTMLSNESSALYNSLLTAEVPTAPDPSQFTRIKYKSGNTEIISYGQNASGPYSHNMTIKRPATKAVMSQSSYNNINLTRSVDSAANDYNFIANINGVNRTLSLVGDKGKLETYEDTLDTYENMQTIESQITDLSKKDKGDKVNASTQQNIKNALGLSFADPNGDNEISQALIALKPNNYNADYMTVPDGYNADYMTVPDGYNADYMTAPVDSDYITSLALPAERPNPAGDAQYAYDIHNAIFNGEQNSNGVSREDLKNIFDAMANDRTGIIPETLREKIGTGTGTGFNYNNTYIETSKIKESADENKNLSGLLIDGKFNDVEKEAIKNWLAYTANENSFGSVDDDSIYKLTQDELNHVNGYNTYETNKKTWDNHTTYLNNKKAWDNHTTYLNNKETWDKYKGLDSLYNIATGNSSADTNITNEEMINALKALLTQVGGDKTSSAAYYTDVVQPAYSAYQSSCATPGLTNVGEGETLFTYEDDNGDAAYIYLPIERISDDIFQTTIDTAKVYENQVSYIEGETVAETVNANVTFDEDGLMTKATLDTGEVLTFEVETELDETAYNAAMVEYEYQVQKYEKELSDANAKLAKIQAQDQKLEVQLTQLETEQKAIQTEIDAVKAVRDKSIERSFKTFS